MAKKQCSICGEEIGLLSYKIEFTDGKIVCKNCVTKAGVNTSDLAGITFEMIKEWTINPKDAESFYKEREIIRSEAERIKREQKEEEDRIERERKEKELRRQEEQRKKDEEERLRIERERFPEGRVRVAIEQVSWTQLGAVVGSGNTIDAKLQALQDRGCQIMNVTCYASGDKTAYVQAVIVYREPPV